MRQSTFDNLIRKSYNLVDMIPHKKNRHFSYIVRKNKVLSFGWNIIDKTSPLSFQFNYEYPFIHSEIAAIRNFEFPVALLSRCELVNVRLGKNKKVTMSKPCEDCERLLKAFDFRSVWYTNESGLFVPM